MFFVPVGWLARTLTARRTVALMTRLLSGKKNNGSNTTGPLEREVLLALNHRAVGRSCFPCPRIIDPSIAADYRSRPMGALQFGVIGKCVM